MSYQIKKEEYFLQNSINFFNKNTEKRNFFLKKFNFLFDEISYYLNNCINESEKTIFFCCGNYTISKRVDAKNKYINEIIAEYDHGIETMVNLEEFDHIVIADLEHQKNILKNFLELSKKISDTTRIIILSKSLIWSFLIKLFKQFFSNYSPVKYNFLPYDNLKSYLQSSNLDIIRNEKIILFPFKIPFLTKFINLLFRLPVLNQLCMMNITIVKKNNVLKSYKKNISYIVPCKNEAKNISIFEDEIKSNDSAEFIFGNDKSTDDTESEIKKLMTVYKNVKYYEGPGICKSENVYKGIDESSGEIVIIYDADLTVKFEDINHAIEILNSTNADMINCSRMIYPQEKGAMKTMNFIGNIIFAKFFSIIFNRKITDTLCGTKIFYKKDWYKMKKYISSWGLKDFWGDFDLLLSAYKNNLKIIEIPVHYYERQTGKTKMINLISNTLRMLGIVVSGYYKLKIKK